MTADRRILNGFKVKQGGVIVSLRPLAPGAGVRASPMLTNLCEAFGITDVSVKTHGRRNLKNIVRAFFQGLHDYPRSQRQLAEGLGRKWFDPRRDYRYRPHQPSSTASNAWAPAQTRDAPYN